MTPAISFIVPVRNDATRLETCLRSIQANAGEPDRLEIIVVDNGSTDGSPDVARRLGATVMIVTEGRVSALRNRAARRAASDVFAFVDADHEISNGWIDAALATLGFAGAGAAGAVYLPPPGGTWVQNAYGLLRGQTRRVEDVEWLSSGNLAVTRQAFEAAGGFDTTLEACEDVDFCYRLRAKGFRVVADPRMESVHHGDPLTLRLLFKAELWRGRDNLRVSFRRPVAWNAVPSAMIPVVDGLMLLAAVAGLLAAAFGAPAGLPVTAGALFVIAAGAVLKVLKAGTRATRVGPLPLLQGLVVACVYDVARALALVARAPHRNARSGAAATAS